MLAARSMMPETMVFFELCLKPVDLHLSVDRGNWVGVAAVKPIYLVNVSPPLRQVALASSARHANFSPRERLIVRHLLTYILESMFTRQLFRATVIGIVAQCSFGCASIISGRHAEVAINTTPPGAHVVIHDKRGKEVANVNTPAKVALKRSDRIIFPARYTATIEAPGYQTAQVPMNSTVNPWILGNIVVGGIPGLIIDDATGAAWRPKHDEIYQQLAPVYAAQQPALPGIVPPPPMLTGPAQHSATPFTQPLLQSDAQSGEPNSHGATQAASVDNTKRTL